MSSENLINIQSLKPHPRNKDIYGEEDIKELADKIKESGFINPIVINKNNMIISGHRRTFACIYLGMTEIPYQRIVFKNPNDELERLLLENVYREKSIFQKAQEGKLWEEIEREKSKQRQQQTQFGNTTVLDNVPSPSEMEKGSTRDIIANKVGIGSGRTYERARETAIKIDELKKQGKVKDAEFLIAVLNETVRGAQDISDSNRIDEIPLETKEKVINREIPVSTAVREIKKNLGISSENSKKQKEITHSKYETKICKQCNNEKNILEFYEGQNICRDCHNENARERKKNKNPKNVYGEEMKIDKEKIKGLNIEAVLATVKDTNKSISDVDYDAFTMEFECNMNMFIQNISRYIDMKDIYQIEGIDKENKNKLIKAITNIEETMNSIKNILI